MLTATAIIAAAVPPQVGRLVADGRPSRHVLVDRPEAVAAGRHRDTIRQRPWLLLDTALTSHNLPRNNTSQCTTVVAVAEAASEEPVEAVPLVDQLVVHRLRRRPWPVSTISHRPRDISEDILTTTIHRQVGTATLHPRRLTIRCNRPSPHQL